MLSFLRELRYRLFYAVMMSRPRVALVTLGRKWTWTLDLSDLGAESVVYSAGAGEDISFELELIRRVGCNVILLDPSPTGVKTMSLPGNQHPRLFFEPEGLADRDTRFTFHAPEDRLGDSYKMAQESAAPAGESETVSFPCLSLPTLLKNHGHQRIDLLKMDIEGFEYGVLDQIMALDIPVRQICVEFHHFCLPQFSNLDTMKRILRLRRAGYRLIHRLHWDHTFLRPGLG